MQSMQHIASKLSSIPGLMSPPYASGERGDTVDPGISVDSADLLIVPAVTYNQHRACNALVRRMYVSRGYRVLPQRQSIDDPNHFTLGAWLDGELVATLTGSRDSRAGLLADSLYGHEISSLRKSSRVIGEVTRLAVDSDFRNPDLLRALFRATYQYARAIFGVTDVVVEVNPRHAGYYRRELGFAQIGSLRTCPRVEAPAVLLHRTLGSLRF
jgi:ribosomal protein S18 acetylase RimI-like enzyme